MTQVLTGTSIQVLTGTSILSPHNLIGVISWGKFEAIESVFSDVAIIRLAYLDGVVEIMPI